MPNIQYEVLEAPRPPYKLVIDDEGINIIHGPDKVVHLPFRTYRGTTVLDGYAILEGLSVVKIVVFNTLELVATFLKNTEVTPND